MLECETFQTIYFCLFFLYVVVSAQGLANMKALVLALLVSVLLVGEVTAQMTQALRDKVVSEHNRLRRDAIGPGGQDEISTTTATSMLEMEYDMKLECVAQAYIETQSGGFAHNPNRSSDYAACGGSGYVGENWYSGSPDPDADYFGGATRAWVDFIWPVAWGYNGCSERENYHGDRGCSGTVGHYTQVLWANTYKVGCGYTSAGGTVCNYSPGGNYIGQAPFIVGTACSACPGTHPYCNNGLCSKIDISSCNVNTISDISEPGVASYEACEMLTAGPFTAKYGADVSLSSGWEVWLLPGFSVEQGATLDVNVCGQSLCKTSGSPMPAGCHSCVDRICADYPTCCNDAFNAVCLEKVNSICGLTCEQ